MIPAVIGVLGSWGLVLVEFITNVTAFLLPDDASSFLSDHDGGYR